VQIGNTTNIGTSKVFNYTGNSSTTDFNIGYLISDLNSIDVHISGLKILNSLYTIIQNTNGSYSLRFATAPTTSATIVIKMPYVLGMPFSLGDGFDLFDIKQVDHLLEAGNGWELAGTTCDGTLYTTAYEKLLEQYTNGTEVTETVGGVSVTYKRGTLGYKIITSANKVSMYDAVYTATGTAMYYVLDTTNTQFTLPKTDWFLQPKVSSSIVNDYNVAGLPNITGSFYQSTADGSLSLSGIVSGAFYKGDSRSYRPTGTTSDAGCGVGFDASLSNAIYGSSTTVQPKSNNVLLYFRVGGVLVNASYIDLKNATAGLNNIRTDKSFAKEFYQNYLAVTNSIILSNEYSVYTHTVSAAESITFDSTNIDLTKIATFELKLYIPTLYTITWGSSISWLNAVTPVIANTGIHYFTFRYDSILSKWLGIYGGYYV